MIWLKLGVLLVISLIGVLQFVLDYIYSDRRTERRKKTKVILFVLMIIFLGGSAAIYVWEGQNATELMTEVSGLRLQNDSLILLYHNNQEDAHKNRTSLLARIDTLETKLDPFIQIATSKYPHLSFEKALEMLSQEITKVKEIAKPNTISYSRGEIKKTEKGYDVFVWCKLSKDQPIGALSFTINLPPKSNVDILDISPAGMAMDVRVEISVNKKAAMLCFLPATTGHPGIRISLSDKEDFKIEGNKGFGVQNIQIK